MSDSSDISFDYSLAVHRSLMKRDLIAGVSRLALALLVVIEYVGVVEFHWLWWIPVGPILYFIVKSLTAKDPYLIEIVLGVLLTPDNLYP